MTEHVECPPRTALDRAAARRGRRAAGPGYGRYVGRVGALAVALGIGAAVAAMPAVASADTTRSSGSGESADSASGSSAPSRSARAARPGTAQPAPRSAVRGPAPSGGVTQPGRAPAGEATGSPAGVESLGTVGDVASPLGRLSLPGLVPESASAGDDGPGAAVAAPAAAVAVAVPAAVPAGSVVADDGPVVGVAVKGLDALEVPDGAVAVLDSAMQAAPPVSEPVIIEALPVTALGEDEGVPGSQPVFTAAPDPADEPAESVDGLGAILLSWAGLDGQAFGAGPDDPAAMPLAWAGVAMTRRELDTASEEPTPMAVTTSGEPAEAVGTPDEVSVSASAASWTPATIGAAIQARVQEVYDRVGEIEAAIGAAIQDWTPGEIISSVPSIIAPVLKDLWTPGTVINAAIAAIRLELRTEFPEQLEFHVPGLPYVSIYWQPGSGLVEFENFVTISGITSENSAIWKVGSGTVDFYFDGEPDGSWNRGQRIRALQEQVQKWINTLEQLNQYPAWTPGSIQTWLEDWTPGALIKQFVGSGDWKPGDIIAPVLEDLFPSWSPGIVANTIQARLEEGYARLVEFEATIKAAIQDWTPGEIISWAPGAIIFTALKDLTAAVEATIVQTIEDRFPRWSPGLIQNWIEDWEPGTVLRAVGRIEFIEREITKIQNELKTKINNVEMLIATLKEVSNQFGYLGGVLAPYAGDYGLLANYLQKTVEDAVRDFVVVVKTIQTEGLGTVVTDILQNGYEWTLPVIEVPVDFELPSSSFSGAVIPIAGDLLSFAGTTPSTNPKDAPFGLAINSWSGPTNTYVSLPEFSVNVGSPTTVIYLTPSITFNFNTLRAVFLPGDPTPTPGPDPDPVDPGAEETSTPVEVPKIQFGLAVSGLLPITASISGPAEWGTCSAYSGSGACTAAGGDITLNNVEFTYHSYGCAAIDDCITYDGFFGGNNVDYFTIPSVTLENVPTDTPYGGPSLTIGGTETWLTMNWSPNTFRSQYSDAGFSLIPDIPFTLNLGSFVLEPEGFAIDSLYLQLENEWCAGSGISGCLDVTQATINGITNTTGLGVGPVIISGTVGGSLYDYPTAGAQKTGIYYAPVVAPTIDISAANGELTATVDTVHSLDINIPIEATLNDIYLGSGQNFLNGNNPDSASDLFYIMFSGGSPAGSDSVTVAGIPFNMSDLYLGPGNLGCYQGDSSDVCNNILVPEQSLSGIIGNGFAFVPGYAVRGYDPAQGLADFVTASTTVSLSAAGLSVSTSGSLPDYLLVAGGVNGGSFLVNQINTNQVKINTCLDSDPDACLESVNIYLGAYALGGSSTSTSASTEATSDFETDDNYLVLPYGNADQAAILGGEVPDQSLGLGTTANWIQLGSLESTGLPTVPTVSSTVPFSASVSAGAAGVGYSATIGTTEDPVQAAWSLGQLSLLTSYLLSQYNISVGYLYPYTKSQSATTASVPGVTITNGLSGTSEGVVAIGSSSAAAAGRSTPTGTAG